MKSWLNWTYVIRAAGIFTMGLGVFWHEGALVIAGLGVVGVPTVFGHKEP